MKGRFPTREEMVAAKKAKQSPPVRDSNALITAALDAVCEHIVKRVGLEEFLTDGCEDANTLLAFEALRIDERRLFFIKLLQESGYNLQLVFAEDDNFINVPLAALESWPNILDITYNGGVSFNLYS